MKKTAIALSLLAALVLFQSKALAVTINIFDPGVQVIGIGDFGPGAIREDFEGLLTDVKPVYTSSGARLWQDRRRFGYVTVNDGRAGTDGAYIVSDPTSEQVVIDLDESLVGFPVYKLGISFGKTDSQSSLSAKLEAYTEILWAVDDVGGATQRGDFKDLLAATLRAGETSAFFAFESSQPIKQLVFDTFSQSLFFDSLIFEGAAVVTDPQSPTQSSVVPASGTLGLLVLGLGLPLLLRRRALRAGVAVAV